jgi:hypothetical protein
MPRHIIERMFSDELAPEAIGKVAERNGQPVDKISEVRMLDLCDPSPGDNDWEKERDAPAIANMPSIWRWLRALLIWPASRLTPSHTRQRAVRRLHLMNAYLLNDVGLARLDDEERVHPFVYRSREGD